MLDTFTTLETPEGIDLALRPAGPVPRFWAWLIDGAIRLVLYTALGTALGTLGKVGGGVFLMVLFVVEWFYPVVFELKMQGQTPGKRALGLRVVQDNGTPIAWGPSVLRNLLRFVDFLPLGYGAALISMLWRDDAKRLGDLAAGTLVVYTEPRARPPRLPETLPLAPPWPLALEQQRALVDFAARAPTLTTERAQELASILTPLLGVSDAAAAPRLYRYAQWLVGRR